MTVTYHSAPFFSPIDHLHNPKTPRDYEFTNIIISFGGDRGMCCDRIFTAYDEILQGAKVVGMVGACSLAYQGEMREGTPTIVGLYVIPSHRRRGIGTTLVKKAIQHSLAINLPLPIRFDAIDEPSLNLFQKLPEEIRVKIRLNNFTLKGMIT